MKPHSSAGIAQGTVQEQAHTSQRERWWSRAKLGLGVAGILIAVAAFLVPVIVERGEKATSADTLAVRNTTLGAIGAKSEEYGAPLGTVQLPELKEGAWAVPLSAPIDTFPGALEEHVGGQMLCSAEQFEWLEAFATPLTGAEMGAPAISLRIANEATTGGMLSLSNVRFEADGQYQDGWVQLYCPAGDRGPGTSSQPVLLVPNGESAVFGEGDPYWPYPDELVPAGTPVTINLGPGEIMHYRLGLTPDTSLNGVYTGRIVADLADGSGTTVELVGGVTLGPGGPPQFAMGFSSEGTLLCSEIGAMNSADLDSRPEVPCPPEEAARRFDTAAAVVHAR